MVKVQHERRTCCVVGSVNSILAGPACARGHSSSTRVASIADLSALLDSQDGMCSELDAAEALNSLFK